MTRSLLIVYFSSALISRIGSLEHPGRQLSVSGSTGSGSSSQSAGSGMHLPVSSEPSPHIIAPASPSE